MTYPIQGDNTMFEEIYDRFLGKITDDIYFSPNGEGLAEWTLEDTKADLFNILMDAIPGFEFPRFPLYDFYEVKKGDSGDIINLDEIKEKPGWYFNCHLTSEEINIFALLMYNVWLQRQIASIEQTRMKYSGSDFKMTSQANHLAKLMELKREAERQAHHMQRLYKRRKMIDSEGSIKSNWSTLAETSALDEVWY